MARIGISGSYGGLNMGDEAILTAMLASLRAARPGDELVVFSRKADHTRRHHDVDGVAEPRNMPKESVLEELERLDLFLLGGGGLLYDTEARWYLRDVRLAQERGIPTFGYALGAGPLDNPEDRAAVCDTLDRMEGLTVRDEVAKRVLQHVGVEAAIDVTADPALLLQPEPFTTDMLFGEGVDQVSGRVGMSVREPGKAASDLDVDSYHALLSQVADFIVKRFDADVLFVPMERGDIRHSHAVIAGMLAPDRAHVLKGRYSPGQVLGLMEHLDFVVGMRLHFLIFAALQAVPFLPLPYATKVSAFVERVGASASASVNRESAGTLLAELDALWDRREQIGAELPGRVHPLVDLAAQTCAGALTLLDVHGSRSAS
jgi:polysaccharide pyruvyl transferase CsaB